MKLTKKINLIFLISVFNIANLATARLNVIFAQTPKDESTGYSKPKVIIDAKGRKTTIINFDETSIDGKARAPEGFLIMSRKGAAGRGIIELRKQFRLRIKEQSYEGLDAISSK